MAKRKRTGNTTTEGGVLNRRGRALVATVHKDLRPWVKEALAHGWTIDARGNRHLTLAAPDGYRVPIPSNANNALRLVFRDQLRNHGVPLEGAH